MVNSDIDSMYLSELVSDSNPSVVQIISSAEDLQEIPVWSQRLSDVVDLFWLLRLATALGENDVTRHNGLIYRDISFDSDQARLFGML